VTGTPPAPEGWYRDPYGRHEDRWFSAGTPTALVRDQGTEGHDDPPDYPPAGPPEELPDDPAYPGDDLRRADAAEALVDDGDLRRADEAEADEDEGRGDGLTPVEQAFDAEQRGYPGESG
jgi:hypothetical protein